MGASQSRYNFDNSRYRNRRDSDDFETPLGYQVEYAKSSRAHCCLCKQRIEKESLRLGIIVESPFHKGTIPRWYHFPCFFSLEHEEHISTYKLVGFNEIRNEDQAAIRERLSLADFRVEYAKSGRATCVGCHEKIIKGETRIGKKDYDAEQAMRFNGFVDRWYHVECFAQLRDALGYNGQGIELPGAGQLLKEDLEKLKALLSKNIQDDMPSPPKKFKIEPEDMELMKQIEELYAIKNQISRLEKKDMVALLAKNNQEVPADTSDIINFLSDMLYFGALQPCPQCQRQLIYDSGLGYKCIGNATEWYKCEYVTQDPERKECEIPSEMKENFPIQSYTSIVRKRLLEVNMPSSSSSVERVVAKNWDGQIPRIQGRPRPLKNMQFVIIGRTNKDKKELKKDILLLGGTVITKIHQNLTAVISNETEVKKMNKRMKDVQAHNVQVVTEDFIEEAKKHRDAPVMLLREKTISSWGSDINARLSDVIAKSPSEVVNI
ncbi:PREDICTED: poly [ADP-ribose] polymerase-like [Wasmannia auropunctata]|uniref:poly [ADP-ribose] polymerase-like n=1 Tax=Wasmannia auropunctata TaxID=64793 RepID=UPI0005F09611|nr:PREDICTED: poly [ADP-ribose] polymerase-like [Wasmannia auropunctata]